MTSPRPGTFTRLTDVVFDKEMKSIRTPNKTGPMFELLSDMMSRLDIELDQPFRISATTPSTAKLLIKSNRIKSGDGGERSIPPIDGAYTLFPETTIDFVSGAITGGTVTKLGTTFSLPTVTQGQFIRVAFVYKPATNSIDIAFSIAAASLGALQAPEAVLALLDGLPLGYIELEALAGGGFKTPSAPSGFIENTSGGNAFIHRFSAAGSGSGSGGGGGDNALNLYGMNTTSIASVRAGYVRDSLGRELGRAADFTLNLIAGVNTAGVTSPLNNTAYYLYIDNTVLPAETINVTTGRATYELATGTSGAFIILIDSPENVDQSRFIPLTTIKTNSSTQYDTYLPRLSSRFHAYPTSAAAGEVTEDLKLEFQDSIFSLLTPVDFQADKDFYVDLSSTGAYDRGTFDLDAGETFVSINLFDSLTFLNDPSIIHRADVSFYWHKEAIDTNAVYAISRDGGVNWSALSVTRAGAGTNAFFASHVFTTEPSFQTLVSNASAQTTTVALNASNETSTPFTLPKASVLTKITLSGVMKTGAPQGSILVYITTDASGVPGDILASASVLATAVTTGADLVVDISDVALKAGVTYRLLVRTDAAYKLSYTGSAFIALSANVSGLRALYLGYPLDLRIRVTGSTGFHALLGLGVFYLPDTGMNLTNVKMRDAKIFTGTQNLNSFSLAFVPDLELLNVYHVETGQVYKYPAFSTQGSVVSFPADTFSGLGQVTLIFDQTQGGSFDNSDLNAALLSSNFLGSFDPNVSRAQPGRGIRLMRPDGVLVELTVNNANQIEIYTGEV